VKDGGEACAVEEEDDVEVEAVVAVGLLAVVGALDTREAFDILVLVEDAERVAMRVKMRTTRMM
jgi:hypothetical protein